MKPSLYIDENAQICLRQNGVDIPFEDQPLARKMLFETYCIFPKEIHDIRNSLHTFPSDQYKVEVRDEDTVEDGGGCYVTGSKQVAILTPIQPKDIEGESQEDAAEELYNFLDIEKRNEDKDEYGLPNYASKKDKIIRRLKSKFTITRKQ